MRIAVMGTGGVGGYYGGLLSQQGHEVIFIARGAHLQTIRERGLQIKSIHGDFQVSPARATDNPAEVGEVDLVLFTTKTYQTDAAAKAVKPMVGQETVVLPLQNGIDAAERIGAFGGKEHLLGGATWLSTAIEAPGVIGQYSRFRRVVFGEFDGQVTERLKRIHEVLQATGITVETSADILQVL